MRGKGKKGKEKEPPREKIKRDKNHKRQKISGLFQTQLRFRIFGNLRKTAKKWGKCQSGGFRRISAAKYETITVLIYTRQGEAETL